MVCLIIHTPPPLAPRCLPSTSFTIHMYLVFDIQVRPLSLLPQAMSYLTLSFWSISIIAVFYSLHYCQTYSMKLYLTFFCVLCFVSLYLFAINHLWWNVTNYIWWKKVIAEVFNSDVYFAAGLQRLNLPRQKCRPPTLLFCSCAIFIWVTLIALESERHFFICCG